MKKVLLFVALMIAMNAYAQESVLTNGVYEQKKVVEVNDKTAGQIYVRALEVLSDWAGSQSRSKANVDVQDKDEGLIVYKGKIYLGYGKANMLYGWDTYADFTLKVRCKDGKVQLTMTVPSMSFQWDGDGHGMYSMPLTDFLPVYNYKGDYKIKKAAQKYAPMVPTTIDNTVTALALKIKEKSDDDF
jgi:hypothetical protein